MDSLSPSFVPDQSLPRGRLPPPPHALCPPTRPSDLLSPKLLSMRGCHASIGMEGTLGAGGRQGHTLTFPPWGESSWQNEHKASLSPAAGDCLALRHSRHSLGSLCLWGKRGLCADRKCLTADPFVCKSTTVFHSPTDQLGWRWGED